MILKQLSVGQARSLFLNKFFTKKKYPIFKFLGTSLFWKNILKKKAILEVE